MARTSHSKTSRLKNAGSAGESQAAAKPMSAQKPPMASDAASVQRAIEYLLALKGPSIDPLLSAAGLKPRGTKVQAAQRLRAGIASGKITLDQIQAWLEELEGWGNHQVQFFNVTDVVRDAFASERRAETHLAKHKLTHLLDGQRPLWPDRDPAIFAIRYAQRRLRVCWAQERTWKLRETSEDFSKGDLRFEAYRVQHRRCFHYFDLDTVGGHASLIMSKLPSGDKYSELIESLLADLDPFLATAGLQLVDLRAAVVQLEADPQVLRRRLNLVTDRQTAIEIVSGGKAYDAYADPSIKTARDQWAGHVAANRGHFYWKITTDDVERLIGTKLLPGENRFSIEGQCSEKEVLDVLRCMRAIS